MGNNLKVFGENFTTENWFHLTEIDSVESATWIE